MFPDVAGGFTGIEDLFEVEACDPVPPVVAGELVLVPGPDHGTPPLLLRARPDAMARMPEVLRAASAAVAREVLYPILGVAEESADYESDRETAHGRLGHHRKGCAVLMAPISEDTLTVALHQRLRFPQKTTYFAPKPRAGLVLALARLSRARPQREPKRCTVSSSSITVRRSDSSLMRSSLPWNIASRSPNPTRSSKRPTP